MMAAVAPGVVELDALGWACTSAAAADGDCRGDACPSAAAAAACASRLAKISLAAALAAAARAGSPVEPPVAAARSLKMRRRR